MRKIVIAALATLSVLVLVFSFDASRRGETVTTTAASSGGSFETQSSQNDGSSASDDGGSSNGGQGSSSVSGTFTGEAAQTQWGPVQVRIAVKDGRIVQATAIEYPQENHRDIEINSWAIPKLEQETVDNNGQVDSYSGATVTCDGYRRSLQSALDQANI